MAEAYPDTNPMIRITACGLGGQFEHRPAARILNAAICVPALSIDSEKLPIRTESHAQRNSSLRRICYGKIVEHRVLPGGVQHSQVPRVMRPAERVGAVKVPLGVANQATVPVVILSERSEFIERLEFSGLVDPENSSAANAKVAAQIAPSLRYAN